MYLNCVLKAEIEIHMKLTPDSVKIKIIFKLKRNLSALNYKLSLDKL